MESPAQDRLDSWKEIAQYLRRDVTTAIRWERERGLPVRRVPGRKSSSRVFAYVNELDEWLHRTAAANANDVRPQTASADGPEAPEPAASPSAVATKPGLSRRTMILAATAVMGCVLLTATAVTRRTRSGGPATLTLAGNSLEAKDAEGERLWKHVFEGTRATDGTFVTGDLDGDGRSDALAAVGLRQDPADAAIEQLHRFSPDGDLLWSVSLSDRVSFAAGAYGPPWATSSLRAFRVAGQSRIAWAVHHWTWWPSLLITLDERGRRLGTFVNSGWIAQSAATPDERHLVVVGMSNAHRSNFFAVLDARQPTGSSPEPAGAPTQCRDCPPGGPLHYYIFPRTDVSGHFASLIEQPGLVLFPDGTLQVHVLDSPGPSHAATIYEFGPDFRVRDVRISDSFREWHGKLESSAALRHPLADCPDRQAREVRHWTPTGGWQTLNTAVQ